MPLIQHGVTIEMPMARAIRHFRRRNAQGTEVAAIAKTWDKLNRVRTLTTTKRTGRVVSSFDYRYDSLGRRTEVHQEDGTYWDYGYDGLDQVVAGQKKLRGGEDLDGWQYGYAYDGIGNRTGTTVNGRAATYTPNALNQYTQRTVPGAVDAVGVADPQATVTVNAAAAGRQVQFFHGAVACNNTTQPVWQQVTVRSELTSAPAEEVSGHAYVPKTAEAFTYDDDGNLLTDGRWQYTWDGENRLIRMESISSVPAAAKRKLVFDYDRRSRRVRKTVYDWDAGTGQYKTTGSATLYLWDGWTLVAEGSPTGTRKRGYLWNTAEGHKSLVGVSSIGDATTTDAFAVVDGNDNVRTLLSPATGEAIAVYEYGPFAEPIRETGPSVTATPIRFSSEYRDAETGLVYYGYRYYAPGIGRWVSRDPIDEVSGTNLYMFSANNAANLGDMLGLQFLHFDGGSLILYSGKGYVEGSPPTIECGVITESWKAVSGGVLGKMPIPDGWYGLTGYLTLGDETDPKYRSERSFWKNGIYWQGTMSAWDGLQGKQYDPSDPLNPYFGDERKFVITGYLPKPHETRKEVEDRNIEYKIGLKPIHDTPETEDRKGLRIHPKDIVITSGCIGVEKYEPAKGFRDRIKGLKLELYVGELVCECKK